MVVVLVAALSMFSVAFCPGLCSSTASGHTGLEASCTFVSTILYVVAAAGILFLLLPAGVLSSAQRFVKASAVISPPYRPPRLV
jgi:hypothetical protein